MSDAKSVHGGGGFPKRKLLPSLKRIGILADEGGTLLRPNYSGF